MLNLLIVKERKKSNMEKNKMITLYISLILFETDIEGASFINNPFLTPNLICKLLKNYIVSSRSVFIKTLNRPQ